VIAKPPGDPGSPGRRNVTRVHVTRQHLEAGPTDEHGPAHHAVILAVQQAAGDPEAEVSVLTGYDPVLITCRQVPRTCWHAVSPPAAEALMTADYHGMTAEQRVSLLNRADAGLLWFDLTWTPGEPPEPA
jgi:hypothetical protein